MQYNKAIVIFEDNTTLWYLRLLKKGYRHCYIILTSDSNTTCIELNPMSNKFFIHSLHKIRLKSFLQGKKHICIDGGYVPLKAMSIGIFTCVEVVKRVLGIDKKFIFTPHQLYTYLQKIGKKSLTFEKKYSTTKISQRD